MAPSAAANAGGEDLDALGLLALASGAEAVFGDVDVSGAVHGLKATSGLNDLPSAELRLDLDLLGGRPPDYFAVAELARVALGQKNVLFSGSVLSAEPRERSVELSLGSMPEMRERTVGAFAAWMVSTPEIVHAMTRSAGLQEGQLNIQGLDSLPMETFEVVTPVEELAISGRARIDEVHLLTGGTARTAMDRLGVDQVLADRFNEAACHAVTFVTARRMFDAEQEAVQRIDVALAWLAVQAHYGSALWPDGTPRQHERAMSRAAPRRGGLTWVRGLMSSRQWIRSPQPVAQVGSLALDSGGQHGGAGRLRLLSLQERQAIVSVGRAGAAGEPVEAITALWEALEFYVAGIAVREMFSPQQMRMLRKALPTELPAALRQRALNAINRLNEPPLLSRLRAATEVDGLMLSDGEWDLLSRLRRVRNEAVHGATQTTVGDGEIKLGVSIVARLLIHRAYRRRVELDRSNDGR